jgi:hypothetical protein
MNYVSSDNVIFMLQKNSKQEGRDHIVSMRDHYYLYVCSVVLQDLSMSQNLHLGYCLYLAEPVLGKKLNHKWISSDFRQNWLSRSDPSASNSNSAGRFTVSFTATTINRHPFITTRLNWVKTLYVCCLAWLGLNTGSPSFKVFSGLSDTVQKKNLAKHFISLKQLKITKWFYLTTCEVHLENRVYALYGWYCWWQ